MFDASGNPVRSPYLVREPVTGATVKLTLDANLQKVAQDAIYRGMQIAHADHQYYANYGSVVAINPENGAIYAMASYPTYKPTVWVPPYDGQAKVVDPKNTLFPQVDKSYAGTYPPGSTFKPITAVAAWMSGLIGPGSTRPCTTSFQSPNDFSHHKFFNWGPENSIIGLSKALEISCDTFFYRLGDQFYDRYQTGSNIFQEWIRKLGYGDSPPVDIPGAVSGLVPDRQWKAHNPLFVNGPNPSIDTLWEPGDDIQMAIGQGYLLVSPLQQAVAYSAIENGGTVVTPHLVQSVTGPDGEPCPRRQRHAQAAARPAPAARAARRDQDRACTAPRTRRRHIDVGLRQLPADRLRQDGHRRGASGLHELLRRLVGGLGASRTATRSSSSR